ncbi:MAG: hypothetical protein IT184_09095 [Acidobacteria bacterium]|nr:hypothetical protein [Acidobacteriota bacterium]
MTDWAVVWLGVMAVSLALMAIIQIALIAAGIRLVLRMSATIEDARKELRPLLDKVNRIADDAAKAASLATLQVERIDQAMAATAARVDEAATVLRAAMGGPIRQGAAVVMAIKAILSALRRTPAPAGRGRHDDEDTLFVG